MSDDVTAVAPDLPADFWEQSDIRSPLLSQHFGRFLRAYRSAQSPKVKQADLAAWLGITQGQLSKLERSPAAIHDLVKLQKWAEALRVPADLLWFSGPQEGPARLTASVGPAEGAAQELSDVPRRDLLKSAGALAVSAASAGLLANAPWQRLMDSVEKDRPVDMATVQLMQDRTADFHDNEHTAPARQLLEGLLRHRAVISALLANARTDAARNELVRTFGETEALVGWLHFDLGNSSEAVQSWRKTLKIAKDSGDGPLAACALSYWSYLASSRNDTIPAIRLLQQAESYVPGNTAPATRSWVAAREAEELSRLGNETEAMRALERAFTAFDFAHPRTERHWTTFFTANRLGSLTVSTYMGLRHKDAPAIADSLLASLPPTVRKQRALALADLTTLCVRANDYERARSLVDGAIDSTIRTESSLSRQRLLTLSSELASADVGSPGNYIRESIRSGLRR
ncbi:helix-turn-helix domain-containing protein [Amycolatopsis sp. CA-161197]|uniref:helix-turn-helix domain-containing protein n=1 Tax=Amycolatopsis sp. CA-161197 TaxID=3239922 RepID=UPI003D9063D1